MSYRRSQSKRNEILTEETKPRNGQSKWQFLRQISVIRAITSLPQVDDTKKTESEPILNSHSSYTAIDVEPVNRSPEVLDKSVLDQLVEDRGLLERLGGVEGVAERLGTSLEYGLISDKIASQREKFGSNEFKNLRRRSSFHIVWRALLDHSIVIMAICGALSLGFGIPADGLEGAKEGVGIFTAIFLAVGVSFISKYCHSKVLVELQDATDNVLIDVVRGGRHQKVPTLEIVVGDVVFLKPGDQTPGHGLRLDNSFLKTEQLDGESHAEGGSGSDIELNTVGRHQFLLSATKVVDGFGWMLVTSVGMNESKIDHNPREEAILQLQLEAQLELLDRITDSIGYVLAFFFLLFTLIGNFTFMDDQGQEKPLYGIAKISAIVHIVVGIITTVVNIPNPWKLSLSLTSACVMNKLMANKALVLKASTLEALTYANTICIDTTNMMKVIEFWLPSGKQFLEGRAYELLEEGIALNSISGGLTEKAILSWATEDLKMDVEKVKMNCDIVGNRNSNSDEEIIGILAKRKADDCEVQAHWFGDAETILPMCSSYYDAFGIVKDINENQRSDFKKIVQAMEESGLKCIAFANKQTITEELKVEYKLEEHNEMLSLLGVVGIYNICRAGVKDTVAVCREAGVNVKMITGDNISVAKAMATKCGIVSHDENVVIESADFRKLLPNDRRDKVDKICVMASSTTSDKLLLLKCLKQKGEMVAIISDATNYESAVMKEADVVISMGIQGDDDDESAGIVILDGNFASISKLLEWGRCLCNNVRKFIQFQLTASFSALVVNFVGAFSGEGVSLTTIQLLWVDIVTNTLGALAFSREKPVAAELMKMPPACKTDPIITNIMLRNILPQTLYQIALLLVLNKGLIFDSQVDKVNLTFLFNSYLLCQVFNEFNSRKLEKKNVFQGLQSNRLFLSIIAITVILQVMFVEILKTLIDTERLTWSQWGLCAGIAFATLPIGWIAKLVPVPKKQVFSYVMVLGQVNEYVGRPILTKMRSFSIWASWVLTSSNQRQRQFLRMTHHAQVEEE